MANKKRKIRVSESTLVDMIENIVSEAVAEKKKMWIAEQEKKQQQTIEEQINKVLDKRLKKMPRSKQK